MTASRARAHKLWADRYASEGNALKAAAHYERAYGLLRFGADEECIICLESDPTPIRSGCACRSDSGLAHIECRIRSAPALQLRDRGTKAWWECEVCKQPFTGAMRTGLAEAWWARVYDQPEVSEERLAAAHNLAIARESDGRYLAAERLNGRVLAVRRRVLGEEHPDTLASLANQALPLVGQANAKYAEAERINRAALRSTRRVLGEEHPHTLTSASNLALSLSRQGRYWEAWRILTRVLNVRKRVLGAEHRDTLRSAVNVAAMLAGQQKNAEALDMLEATLNVQRRVLGDGHQDATATTEAVEFMKSKMRALLTASREEPDRSVDALYAPPRTEHWPLRRDAAQ
jgi:tetratricopeptide (TPR) repeat protein